MAEKKRLIKGRDWTFIIYPESAPENWREILDNTHMQWVESPLHNQDKNPDGTLKKAHWHILLRAEGPITITAVKNIIEGLNTPVPQKVGSAKGMVRYFAHLDNPEKYRYDVNDIIPHNGADIADFFKLSTSQNLSAMKDIFRFIEKKKIDNYVDFLDYCLGYGNDDWFDIAINHNTLAINKMLDAMWQKNSMQSGNAKGHLTVADTIQILVNKGYSVSEIADRLNVSRPTVYRWMKHDEK